MYNKVIVMPVYCRPDYTVKVLKGIKNCYGYKDYKIYICVDPGVPEIINAINSVDGLKKKL